MELMSDDPIVVRRRRMARLAEVGQRLGYGLVVVAVAGFAVGLVVGFSPVLTTVVTVALAATAFTLAPAIVLGYSVKAAEREDGQGRRLSSRR